MAALPFRDINVHASSSFYAFSSPSSPSSPTLVIDRPSGDLRLHDGKLLGAKRVSSVAGILGIIRLRLDKYIIIITKAQPMGRLKGNMIYRVVSTELLPLRERALRDPDEDHYLNLVNTHLKAAPMFFSYSFDLTSSFQRQAELQDASTPMWKRADERFFWNRYLQTDLIELSQGTSGGRSLGEKREVDPFILPVIFGMLRITNTSVKGKPLTYVLITRRSRYRAGTRYFSRGVDDQGNVSNFNETEQTIILNDDSSAGLTTYGGDQGFQQGRNGGKEAQVFSYVQTRGSVPVFWAEVNTLHYTPKLQVKNVESAVHAAQRHFAEQIRTYGDNYLVNLVNQKGREQRVKAAYEQMVQLLVTSPVMQTEPNHTTDEKLRVIEAERPSQGFDRLHYVYFDFHSETKGLRWHRAKLLMQQLEQPIVANGYFRAVDMPGDSHAVEVRSRQTAVVRTNCMDCLDRTNVVQSMLGRYILSRQLVDAGVLREGEEADDDAAFEHLFRNVWADNADVVSKAYSGTGALKTDFTRLGVRTKKGMFNDLANSCTRYVKNNFLDGPRQDAYDLIQGVYRPEARDFGAGGVFADRRPLAVQAVPYILAASVFLVLVGSLTRREESQMVWPFRLLMVLALVLAVVSARFVYGHGMLYVNWPKLNTPSWAVDGYQDALAKVRNEPIIGPFVVRHERGKSDARLGYLEEGKKRRE